MSNARSPHPGNFLRDFYEWNEKWCNGMRKKLGDQEKSGRRPAAEGPSRPLLVGCQRHVGNALYDWILPRERPIISLTRVCPDQLERT